MKVRILGLVVCASIAVVGCDRPISVKLQDAKPSQASDNGRFQAVALPKTQNQIGDRVLILDTKKKTALFGNGMSMEDSQGPRAARL